MKLTVMELFCFAVLLAGCNSGVEPNAVNGAKDRTASGKTSLAGKKFDDLNQFKDVDVSTLREGFGIGDLALEISGQDSQGVSFALSDYRGKVVMLDFWGDW